MTGKANVISDGLIFAEQKKREIKPNEEKALAEDEKYIDITEDIREEMIVHLPMKRIAPEYRGKNFEDIFPQLTGKKMKKKKNKDQEIDDRWSALKNIKLN